MGYTSKEAQRQWYLKNRDKIRQRQKETRGVWSSKNPEKYLFSLAKHRAKAKGLEFSIELEDIFIPEKCPYLEISLDVARGQGRGYGNSHKSKCSLDRIDSTKGYIKGNVQVISMLANQIKTNASEEELLTFSRNYLNKHTKEFDGTA